MATRSYSGPSAIFTPRIANALLRRVRDFAMVKGEGHIDLGITRIGLSALNIDSRGLDQMDNKILGTIIEKFGGGPVGLNTIATAVGEDAGQKPLTLMATCTLVAILAMDGFFTGTALTTTVWRWTKWCR